MNRYFPGHPIVAKYVPKNASPSEKLVSNIRRIVSEDENIRLTDVAKHCKVSPGYFSHKSWDGYKVPLDIAVMAAEFLKKDLEELIS